MKGKLEVTVIRGHVLGVPVYRGFAKLSDLARISRADVYDQVKNPTGTQRDLSRKHAKDAYEYVKNNPVAFFPEIVLHARNESILSFTPASKRRPDIGRLSIDVARITESNEVLMSRVDGNHRLYYADGHDARFEPLDQVVGFCIILGIKETGVDEKTGELILFRDINANQKGMNTSHLDSIALRAAELGLEQRDPVLYVAERLMNDKDSPFKNRVYRGGVKPATFMIPLRSLRTSIEYMKQRSKRLAQFDSPEQADLIKNYWKSVKDWIPEAWAKPTNHIALRGAGFWAISFIGADVIDRAVDANKIAPKNMLEVLNSGSTWDWRNSGDFRGFSGRAGAVEISNKVTREFTADGASIAAIAAKLRKARS